jgi:hypothetical protein
VSSDRIGSPLGAPGLPAKLTAPRGSFICQQGCGEQAAIEAI